MKKYLLVVVLAIATILRLYNLSSNPPSMFGDEVDLGYQAYSILHTGRDYQGNFMPLNFHSLAEFRTPLYLYSAVPTVAIFGISPLGVRLPAAIFGILSIFVIYLLIKQFTKNEINAYIAAAVLAISPWHLQYSRAGFEVTEMLFFILLGVYLFFKSFDKPKYLWMSVVSLTITPFIYSTAKLFMPIFMLSIFLVYRKDIFKLPKKNLINAIIAGLIVGIPVVYSTLFVGGAQRFSYISVFSDPTIEPEIGNSRLIEAKVRGETGTGLSPTISDKAFNNKFTFVGNRIISNYLQAFSTDFLFIKGDPDPRQSVGIGEFYRIDFILLLAGLILFFSSKEIVTKHKLFVLAWVLISPISAALTRDGGNHATRLILMIIPMTLIISYAITKLFEVNKKVFVVYLGVLSLSFIFYLHNYYVFYPLASERWWHYGWTPAIAEIKSIDKNYDRVIISMSGEPAWIFFAGNYQYDPKMWQKEYPIGNDVEVNGFGKISHTGKFYFGSPSKEIQIYGLGRVIDSKTLYLANASEVGANLIMDPTKVPDGLKLIKAIAFPSGEPSMYLFSGTK